MTSTSLLNETTTASSVWIFPFSAWVSLANHAIVPKSPSTIYSILLFFAAALMLLWVATLSPCSNEAVSLSSFVFSVPELTKFTWNSPNLHQIALYSKLRIRTYLADKEAGIVCSVCSAKSSNFVQLTLSWLYSTTALLKISPCFVIPCAIYTDSISWTEPISNVTVAPTGIALAFIALKCVSVSLLPSRASANEPCATTISLEISRLKFTSPFLSGFAIISTCCEVYSSKAFINGTIRWTPTSAYW